MPTGVVDLIPLVQGGRCWSEHDEKLLLKAQAAHPRGWVVAACPCQYLPGDGVMELRELRDYWKYRNYWNNWNYWNYWNYWN